MHSSREFIGALDAVASLNPARCQSHCARNPTRRFNSIVVSAGMRLLSRPRRESVEFSSNAFMSSVAIVTSDGVLRSRLQRRVVSQIGGDIDGALGSPNVFEPRFSVFRDPASLESIGEPPRVVVCHLVRLKIELPEVARVALERLR